MKYKYLSSPPADFNIMKETMPHLLVVSSGINNMVFTDGKSSIELKCQNSISMGWSITHPVHTGTVTVDQAPFGVLDFGISASQIPEGYDILISLKDDIASGYKIAQCSGGLIRNCDTGKRWTLPIMGSQKLTQITAGTVVAQFILIPNLDRLIFNMHNEKSKQYHRSLEASRMHDKKHMNTSGKNFGIVEYYDYDLVVIQG